jgi:dihydrolipoamide dehydrogenase
VIVGGGPIGVESAQILSPLGVQVTIVEFLPHLLPREDADVAAVVAESFRRQKITVLAATKTLSVAPERKGVAVTVAPVAGGAERTLMADVVLVATGKRPNIDGLDVEKAGVKTDERGRIQLNEFLQTTHPSLYVAGDAAGQMMFTHVAHQHGHAAGTNAIRGNTVKVTSRVIPRGTFCFPEVGSVGLTEEEAREKKLPLVVGKAPYAYFGKALVTGEMEGLVKIVGDRKTKRILGGHIVGANAAELIHEIALAMEAGVSYETVGRMVHAYPTFAEAVGAAAYGME